MGSLLQRGMRSGPIYPSSLVGKKFPDPAAPSMLQYTPQTVRSSYLPLSLPGHVRYNDHFPCSDYLQG
jgi:hypothetical protein